ncbi:uncharacterized protein LOC102805515 [Saccoglossus kowalevskii]|uniref:Uncharacterized protein LOC102805515 n=1 Tax=Saccoglossus kowalevskii TaxID=10224 RepID=A0ABM0MJI0_SACKO|nr:PREDICTED: uncharacterized protein LOC102805515 [Saccoglossus kowalevskii]
MSFLSRLLKGRHESKPKVDQHGIYTSCQMSTVVMEGKLSIHEPWRKHRKKPKSVVAYLYTNDSSPFLVWYANKAKKQARGCIHTDCCQIDPMDEYSFNIITKNNQELVYKFHADCWEIREEWLYQIRDQSRKKPVMPQFHTNLENCSDSPPQPPPPERHHSRRHRYGHRRTLSADAPSPKLAECSVLLQRSRSQPHLQNKARMAKRRPQLAHNTPTTSVQRTMQVNAFIRSPEL